MSVKAEANLAASLTLVRLITRQISDQNLEEVTSVCCKPFSSLSLSLSLSRIACLRAHASHMCACHHACARQRQMTPFFQKNLPHLYVLSVWTASLLFHFLCFVFVSSISLSRCARGSSSHSSSCCRLRPSSPAAARPEPLSVTPSSSSSSRPAVVLAARNPSTSSSRPFVSSSPASTESTPCSRRMPPLAVAQSQPLPP